MELVYIKRFKIFRLLAMSVRLRPLGPNFKQEILSGKFRMEDFEFTKLHVFIIAIIAMMMCVVPIYFSISFVQDSPNILLWSENACLLFSVIVGFVVMRVNIVVKRGIKKGDIKLKRS